MKKFTIFTILLTAIVVMVALEVGMEDGLSGSIKTGEDSTAFELPENLDLTQVMKTSVLDNNALAANEDLSRLGSSTYDVNNGVNVADNSAQVDQTTPAQVLPTNPLYNQSDSGLPDFENDDYVAFSSNAYLRDDMVKSAGFATAYIEEESHDDFIFKTLYMGDIDEAKMLKYAIRTDSELLAKVYVVSISPLATASEVYEVLKMRAAEGLNSSVNETNDFADNSFYLNDSQRSEVAFLVVRFGDLIYAFSYPKAHHPQIRNLIQLIDQEF